MISKLLNILSSSGGSTRKFSINGFDLNLMCKSTHGQADIFYQRRFTRRFFANKSWNYYFLLLFISSKYLSPDLSLCGHFTRYLEPDIQRNAGHSVLTV